MTPHQTAVNHRVVTAEAERLEAADPRLPRRVRDRIRVAESGCWIWTGHIDHTGYGRTSRIDDYNRKIATHRLVYEVLVGAIPEGLDLDHLCRVRACCNPAHLEAVTRRVNVLRGRTLTAANVQKTHCPQGHEYAGANLAMDGKGRKCRECLRVRAAATRAAKAAVRPPRQPVTHCKYGHEFAGENLRILTTGSRGCRTCDKRRMDERKEQVGIDEWRRQDRERYHARKARERGAA